MRQSSAALRSATGIPVAILERQIGEPCRRLTGTIERSGLRARRTSQLRLYLAGTPERNEANVIAALCNDEAFAAALVFDKFRQEVIVNQPLPWDERGARIPRPWEDADDVCCAERAPPRARIDNAMVKALARAQQLTGAHGTIDEIAAAEKINASYISRILRLTLRAPDIVEAMLAPSFNSASRQWFVRQH